MPVQFTIQTAQAWWNKLELQWKIAFNEAVFGKGSSAEPPKDDELPALLNQTEVLRLAGPAAYSPNVSAALTNLSGIEALHQLRFLSVTSMQLKSIRELAPLTQLRNLYLYDNQIESLEGIETLTELEELYFQNNLVADLRPLQNLTRLRVIYAGNNRIETLEGLTEAHAEHLKRFYILPNQYLPDREAIRLQNELGILARMG
ncbi:MAG: leucine-rich repeat domain-containing protein [Saprospiraceae bacterium]|nr:leucine-rich repeat domain-containing protein [Saprospiraceae bacterium]